METARARVGARRDGARGAGAPPPPPLPRDGDARETADDRGDEPRASTSQRAGARAPGEAPNARARTHAWVDAAWAARTRGAGPARPAGPARVERATAVAAGRRRTTREHAIPSRPPGVEIKAITRGGARATRRATTDAAARGLERGDERRRDAAARGVGRGDERRRARCDAMRADVCPREEGLGPGGSRPTVEAGIKGKHPRVQTRRTPTADRGLPRMMPYMIRCFRGGLRTFAGACALGRARAGRCLRPPPPPSACARSGAT